MEGRDVSRKEIGKHGTGNQSRGVIFSIHLLISLLTLKSLLFLNIDVDPLKEGVSLHSQLNVRFREFFVHFLTRQFEKNLERAENIDFTYE